MLLDSSLDSIGTHVASSRVPSGLETRLGHTVHIAQVGNYTTHTQDSLFIAGHSFKAFMAIRRRTRIEVKVYYVHRSCTECSPCMAGSQTISCMVPHPAACVYRWRFLFWRPRPPPCNKFAVRMRENTLIKKTNSDYM